MKSQYSPGTNRSSKSLNYRLSIIYNLSLPPLPSSIVVLSRVMGFVINIHIGILELKDEAALLYSKFSWLHLEMLGIEPGIM